MLTLERLQGIADGRCGPLALAISDIAFWDRFCVIIDGQAGSCDYQTRRIPIEETPTSIVELPGKILHLMVESPDQILLDGRGSLFANDEASVIDHNARFLTVEPIVQYLNKQEVRALVEHDHVATHVEDDRTLYFRIAKAIYFLWLRGRPFSQKEILEEVNH